MRRDGLTMGRACVGMVLVVLAQASPVLGIIVLGAAAGAVVEALEGGSALREIAVRLLAFAVGAIVATFALHEVAHVVVAGVGVRDARFAIEVGLLRCSVLPAHRLSRRRMAAAALAGPGSCVVLGLVLALASAPAPWVVACLAHGVLLLPTFGDGRALLAALRAPGA